jgi:hypothetical protein
MLSNKVERETLLLSKQVENDQTVQTASINMGCTFVFDRKSN